jgi:hypothetical protein
MSITTCAIPKIPKVRTNYPDFSEKGPELALLSSVASPK